MTFLSLTPAEKRALIVLAVFVAVGGAVQVIQRYDPAAAPGYVLTAREPESTPPPAPPRPADKLEQGIDPSKALQEDLELLPGIGPEMASRIIRYRELHGPFQAPSDLLDVPGIGERTLARITPYLSFP